MAEDISWFDSKEWRAGELKADKDYENGQFEKFDTIDEVINYLHAKKKEKEIMKRKK